MLTTKELREKRVRLAEEARGILDSAAKDKREALRSDEEEKWQNIHKEIDQLAKHIELRERQDEEERLLAEPLPRRAEPGGDRPPLDPGAPHRLRRGEDDSREALRGWLMAGTNRQPTDFHLEVSKRVGVDLHAKQLILRMYSHPLKDLRRLTEWEERALSTTTGSAGGFVVPDDTMRAIEVALLQFGGIRQVSDVIRTAGGAALPYPTANDTAQKGEIIAQNASVNQQDIVFGQMVLEAYKYSSKMILVPVEFLQDAAINVSEFIGRALGERIGRIHADHFTTGTGSGQPNGVVTASVQGAVGATGQTTTVIYDDLVNLEHSVDPAYRGNARFMFADSTLKVLKKLKIPQFSGDTGGQPLWLPSVAGGAPDTILGYPYVINQSMPAMAANAKSILFGDFLNYKIRDVMEIELLRLDERFAEFHQVAFLAFSRNDGDLLNAGTNPIKHYANSAT